MPTMAQGLAANPGTLQSLSLDSAVRPPSSPVSAICRSRSDSMRIVSSLSASPWERSGIHGGGGGGNGDETCIGGIHHVVGAAEPRRTRPAAPAAGCEACRASPPSRFAALSLADNAVGPLGAEVLPPTALRPPSPRPRANARPPWHTSDPWCDVGPPPLEHPR